MRKKQEIKKGITILRMKGDKISLLQAEVLENGHNESQVFATYVASVPEEDKDETESHHGRCWLRGLRR